MKPSSLPSPDTELGALMRSLPRSGRVRWIGLRPKRDVPMLEVDSVIATVSGLEGDRHGSLGGKRGITLIQAEHFPVIAALAGLDHVAPATLRRNLVVEGLPVIALKGRVFRIGEALFEGTGDCDPCSRMEAALGPGGFNAMRMHGGLTARILQGGRIRVGDSVEPLGDASGDAPGEAAVKT
ncbi:MAG: MOSC domain-containing protein [Arenimonas sp.]